MTQQIIAAFLLAFALTIASAAQPTQAAPSGAATTSSGATITSSVTNAPSAAIDPGTANTWCSVGSGFSQVVEGIGLANPNAVTANFGAMGTAASCNIPPGVHYENWDCFNASQGDGPVYLAQVCQITLRGGATGAPSAAPPPAVPAICYDPCGGVVRTNFSAAPAPAPAQGGSCNLPSGGSWTPTSQGRGMQRIAASEADTASVTIGSGMRIDQDGPAITTAGTYTVTSATVWCLQ